MIDSKNEYSFFPGSLMKERILETRLCKKEKIDENMESLVNWAMFQYNNTKEKTISKHWWYDSLPNNMAESFDVCAYNSTILNMFHRLFYKQSFTIKPIHDMNELYIAGKDQKNKTHSDNVFFIPHIDGPFFLLPYASVYRCLIALNSNSHIETTFPMQNKRVILSTGDVLAFDFNREIHYIRELYQSDNPRIVLKSHFCIYPKGWHWYGSIVLWLNMEYNKLFRRLFLHTIQPTNMSEKISSYAVVYSTYTFVWSDMFIGHKNILYLGYLYHLYVKGYISYIWFSRILLFTFTYKQIALYVYLLQIPDIELYSYIRDFCIYGGLGAVCCFLW